jgi:hypothetical protein
MSDGARAYGRWFAVLYGWFFVACTGALIKQVIFVRDSSGPIAGTTLLLLAGLLPAIVLAAPATLLRRDLASNDRLYRFLIVCSALIGIILAAFQPIDYFPSQGF